MKVILLFLGIALMQSSLRANEPIVVSKLPEFETATDWAKALSRRYPSFKLIHSSESKTIWLVLFRTAENNLVWCEKNNGLGSGTKSIQNMDGKSIITAYDPSNDRERPMAGRNFRTEFKIFYDKGWNIYSRDDGSLFGLVQPPPKKIRVQYTFRPKSGGEAIKFNEVIDFLGK